jgi:cytochrome P450
MVVAMSTTAPDLADLDLADQRHWDDGVPWDLFAAMQREAPVHFSRQAAQPDEGGFWSITRFDDLHTVTRDFETFSSERRGIFLVDDIGVPLDVQRLQMISMDPPRHARLKKIVGSAFTPKAIAHHEEAIRGIVTDVLDRVADRESFDLVQDVAKPIPARVIGDMLGTPPEDDEKLVHWTNVFTAFEDPEVRAQWTDTQAVFTDIVQYCHAQIEARRANPTDDLVSRLMNAEVDGDRLEDAEIAVFFILLMAAGNDSTRATYSGIMKTLLENPDLRQELVDDPSLIGNAVEEGLRMNPAFAFMARAATKDVELHGQQIKEGDRVLLWYLASNRDASVYENPHEFDLHRPDIDGHQAFGARGRHFCLGAALARLELRIWIEETLKRMPDLEIDGECNRVRALFLNQYNAIPVRRGSES